VSLPPVGSTPPNVTRLPGSRVGGGGGDELPVPGQAPIPGLQPPERPRRPARISAPREWIVYVECKLDGVTLHPTERDLSLKDIEVPPFANPLRSLVTGILQRQPEPQPGKSPPQLRVRFVVHPEAGRTFHAAYPALQGLPVEMDRVTLQRGDDVRAALGQ
jgi:hypothetical protein